MPTDRPARSTPTPPVRKGAVPRPVHPEGAVVESVLPIDPLGLGQLTFPLRRPRTRRVLEQEFGLTRRQAHAVAVRLQTHRVLKRRQLRARVRFWGAVALGVLVLGVLVGPISVSAYLDWAADRPESHPANLIVSVSLALLIALAGPLLWLIAERHIQDRLVEDELRRCWGEQECIWCGRDMDGCVVDRERWSRCPECGLRSPIGARASTI